MNNTEPGRAELAQVDEFELATARLDWARAARCVDLPSQREAMQWHVECCLVAQSEVTSTPGGAT
jgi:hypothetical protein